MTRCHRVGPPGEISSPGGNGLRKFSPPGDFVRSYFQGLGSAPRAKPPGMRTRVCALYVAIPDDRPVAIKAAITWQRI